MTSNSIEERRTKIISLIEKNDYLTVEAICKALNLKDSTVRRDLIWLENQKIIRRFHGGVTSEKRNLDTFDIRHMKFHDEKKRIGKTAADLISDNDTIFLGAGSTVAEMSNALLKRSDLNHVIIVAAALNIARIFIPDRRFETVVLGGVVEKEDESTTSKMAIDNAAQINYTKTFNGVMGISAKKGIMQPSAELVLLERTVMERSEKNYRLADHTKFNAIGPFTCCALSEVTLVISNWHDEAESLMNQEEYQDKVLFV